MASTVRFVDSESKGKALSTQQLISPTIEDLLAVPGNFSFPQAVQLLAKYLGIEDISANPSPLRFRVNPNLAFPPSDILQVNLPPTHESHKPANIILNLMGLHGAGSPLPAYFTEYVAQYEDEQDTLRDFFDLFNHRLIQLLYNSWEKYRYYFLFRPGATDTYSNHFFSFIGLGHKSMRQAKELNWSKLLPFMGLIAFSGDAAGSLESIMRHYFSHQHVSILPCIIRKVQIPKDQQNCLGLSNTTLSMDCLIGEKVLDQTGKFRLQISKLHWERFNDFLPCNVIFVELKELLRFVLRSRMDFDIELHLLPEEIPPLQIGEETICRLGWSTWLGENGDGKVILQTA